MENLGIAYLTLYASDLDASRRFYAGVLGLTVKQDEPWGLVLSAGPIEINIHPKGDHPSQHCELVFTVTDLALAFDEVRTAGVTVLQEPAVQEWGDSDGAVADPDGNRVYLRARS